MIARDTQILTLELRQVYGVDSLAQFGAPQGLTKVIRLEIFHKVLKRSPSVSARSPLVKILLAHSLGHAIQRRRHFYRANRSDNVDLLYNSYPGFDFDDLEDDECLSEFRFYKNELTISG
ncbi:hypothetical protein pdam_00010247 [Pocillopora damicornis]|uniref:Uncharacterized protein n=1 Tax=Pocillopora damicornis TaxID=46731 RepID=A0A3M6TB33_POCDA|nr:hypothetical protein pdam_00010247 [Pocillopora damicornis]